MTMKTLCEQFAEQVKTEPNRVAVHHRGKDVTYAQIADNANCVASHLIQQGLEPGERVVLLLTNSAEYVACYLGIQQAGGIVVALNPETTPRELTQTLNDALPWSIICGPKALPTLQEWATQSAGCPGADHIRLLIHLGELGESTFPAQWHTTALTDVIAEDVSPVSHRPALDDVSQLIYTSGTTGRPKGVTLSHRNIAANCHSILDYLTLTRDDSILVTLPFFYSYGNSLLFTHLAVGGRMVLASNVVFWNQVLDLMQVQRATGFAGVPSSYAMLLHQSDFRKREFPHLRYLTCAGGGLAPAVVEQLRESVPEVLLFLMYGQTEATARLSTLMPEELDEKLGSIGRGLAGVELAVLDKQSHPVVPGKVGEIVARGDNVMIGYWNDGEETGKVLRQEGLHTGDLARIDDDGYIYIVGRKSDIIKSGSYRLNPKEIEEVILELDGVAEVAVVGLPDEMWGESPTAFIVSSSQDAAHSEVEIFDHCRNRLPRYKVMRAVHFVDSLPKTSSGKVRRSELKISSDTAKCRTAMESH